MVQRGFQPGFPTVVRRMTVLSRSRSPVQIQVAPLKSCSKNGCFGSMRSCAYSTAAGHAESSKPGRCQPSGSGSVRTFGSLVSRSMGPCMKHFAFQRASVTVPSANLRMKPPSPIWLPYSQPVFGSALSLASTAMVIGYSGRMSTATTLCGRKSIESTATCFPFT